MWLPYKIFFVILHLLILPLNIISVLILIFFKYLVRFLAKLTHGRDFAEPIKSSNALFLADQIWSRPHSSVIACVQLNGAISKEEATNIFQKLYDQKEPNGVVCYRELGFSLVRFLGFGFWKKVPNFKISDRIHLLNQDVLDVLEEEDEGIENDEVSSSKTITTQEAPLTSIVEGMLREPYKKDEPLWDVYILNNHKNRRNRTLVIIRFHHLMADGMSFVKLLYNITGSSSLPKTSTKPSTSFEKWDKLANSIFTKIGTGISLMTVGVIDYLNDVLFEKDKNNLQFDENGKLKLTGNWMCAMGNRLDVSQLKKGSRSYGCSIVHILFAGISNGLEQYFYKYHGKDSIPEGFHFVVPLPIPKHPDRQLCNHYCLAKLKGKFGIDGGNAAVIKYFKEETRRCAVESMLPIMSAFTFQFVCGLLPVKLADLVSKSKATFTVMMSNVVGPQDNRRLGEAVIDEMFFWMPIPQEALALAAGVISCNGGLRVCLTADKGCIPDRSRLEDLGKMIDQEILNICGDVEK